MSSVSYRDVAQAIYLAKKNGAKERQIAEFLARKRLLAKSSEILGELQKIIDSEGGAIVAKIESAKRLTPKVKKEIEVVLEKRYHTKKITLEEKLKPELLGGFKVMVRDEVLDMSYRNKLEQLKSHLMKS